MGGPPSGSTLFVSFLGATPGRAALLTPSAVAGARVADFLAASQKSPDEAELPCRAWILAASAQGISLGKKVPNNSVLVPAE